MSRKLIQTLVVLITAPLLLAAPAVHAQQNEEFTLFSPQNGEVVQGLVQVIGTVDPNGLQSYEVAFAFMQDATQTWFQIASGTTPVFHGVLAEWDTTVLTDNDYNLLLRVHFQDGDTTEIIVEGIRVRNYSSIETATPDAAAPLTQPTETSLPALTAIGPPLVTPTDLPENPAAVDAPQLTSAIKGGAVVGIVLVVGTLLYSRSKRRNDTL